MFFQRIHIILIFLFFSICVSAQDTLCLMSGRYRGNVCVLHVDTDYVLYKRSKFCNDNAVGRIKLMKRSNVFEIRKSDGTHNVLYEQDSISNLLTTDQAHSYLRGCHDLTLYRKDWYVGPLCYVITLGSFVFLPAIAVMGVPSLYTGAALLLTTSFDFENIDESKVDKYYMMGFQDRKKLRIVKSSIIFGVAAIITGYGIHYITK